MADEDDLIVDSDEDEIINNSDYVMRKPRVNKPIHESDTESESDEDVNIEDSFIGRPNIRKKNINRILSDSEDDINENEDVNTAEVSIRKAIRRSIYKVAHDDPVSSDDDTSQSDVDTNVDDQEVEHQKNSTLSDDHEEKFEDYEDHDRNEHSDHGKKQLKYKNDINKNNSYVIPNSDDDDRDSVKNTSSDVSNEDKTNKSKSDYSSIITTPREEDDTDHDDSHKSINSSSEIVSSNDNTKEDHDEYEIIDKSALATGSEQKKSPKRSLSKPVPKSKLKKEIKRLLTEIERLKIFLMQGNIERLPDKGKKIKNLIVKNQESLDEYKKQLEQIEDSNSSVASTDLSHNISSDKDSSLNDPNSHLHNSYNSPEANASHHSTFDRKNLLKPTASTVTEGLGKRALATFQNEQVLTVERLEHLHGSLTSQPSENEQVKAPHGLTVRLMPHQKHALAWLAWREKQKPPGGVLADDMGLGKTLTMISLVMKSLVDNSSDDDEDDDDNQNEQCKYQGGTLVVCPASLINQWKNEIEKRTKRGILVTEVYHGNNREKVPRRLARNDIVITTYNLLVRESKNNGQIYQIQWKRVILDEAHAIRNHKSQACAAVCQLKAKKRWALTGTPIHNKGMDIFAILKFLKCSPFDDIRVWKRWVENKSDAGVERLAMVMKSLMLRRTKKELIAKGEIESLPEKHIEVIKISLDKDERPVYDKVMMYSRTIFAQFLHQRAEKETLFKLGAENKLKNNYNSHFNKAQQRLLAKHADVQSFEILVLLLRLRQICCQPSLIHDMLDKNEIEMNDLNEGEEAGQSQNNLVAQLKGLDISGNTSDHGEENEEIGVDKGISEHLLTSENPVFNPKRCSSKLTVILNLVRDILDKKEKIIIVSQWSTYLQIIGENLRKIPGATFEMFTGAVAVKNRQGIIDSFNEEKNPKILLLSLCAGGVGLNLVGANHLLLVDIHWNPQLECQAQDRIYRFGQKKNVYVYKLICSDTIEETIQKLQDNKMSLANSILSGKNKECSKLSVQDLMTMFNFK